MRQPSLKELAAEVAKRIPATLAAERSVSIQAARYAAADALERLHAGISSGRLRICGDCSRYTFGSDPAGAGNCALHGDGLLAFAMLFDCREFAKAGDT